MKRRNFLQLAGQASALPFLLGGFSVKAFGQSPMLRMLAQVGCEDRILVLVQLAGGNDGLNTVIPLDQYANYQAARPNIAIGSSQALKLTTATGLNPQMTGLHQLYNNGKVRVIQSVGYPTPDFSHFRSTDIWNSASESDQIVETGWLGRWLDTQYPGFPIGYPKTSMPDPVAIQIGSAVSPALESAKANMGMAFTDPTTYYNIVNYGQATQQNTRFRHELDFVRQTGLQIQQFATPVKNAAAKTVNKSTQYPTKGTNLLADQLKIVAQLIAGGLKTRVYVVTQTGYDTHSAQNTGGNGTPFTHLTLLQQLSQAISAFQDDIALLGVEDKVVGMTFSEFGRRIKQNGSQGTDHGPAAPLFVFGSNVVSGVLGANPTIPSSVTLEDNIPMLFDFRSVYASLLRDWFCVPQAEARNLLFSDFPMLPIIKNGFSTDVNEQGEMLDNRSIVCSPNPATDYVNVRFRGDGTMLKLALFDHTGRQLAVVAENIYASGQHELQYGTTDLPSGNYYWRLQSARNFTTAPMIVVR